MPGRKQNGKVGVKTNVEPTAIDNEEIKVSYGAAVVTTHDYLENDFVIKKFFTESARNRWSESLEKQAESDPECTVRHLEASDLKTISEFLKTPVRDYGREEPLAKAVSEPVKFVDISEKEVHDGGLDWLKESGIRMEYARNEKYAHLDRNAIADSEFGSVVDSSQQVSAEVDVMKPGE